MFPTRHFNDDWVSARQKKWWELSGRWAGQKARFVEIGCHEGRSACWWLDNVLTDPQAELICIDPWQYRPEREDLFDANTASRAAQVRKIKASSHDAIVRLERRSIDFAYVDGSHEACDVILDGLLLLPRMKIGGVILFDDYQWEGPNHRHFPKEGIDAFLSLCDWRLEVAERGWQLAVKVIE